MASELRFHPLVAMDLKAAVGWDDEISPTLGDRFRASVEQRFDSISLYPESFGIVLIDARVALRGFPYLLLFEVKADAIEVLGVFHTASDPSKWRSRLR